jgi:hypothetical protein
VRMKQPIVFARFSCGGRIADADSFTGVLVLVPVLVPVPVLALAPAVVGSTSTLTLGSFVVFMLLKCVVDASAGACVSADTGSGTGTALHWLEASHSFFLLHIAHPHRDKHAGHIHVLCGGHRATMGLSLLFATPILFKHDKQNFFLHSRPLPLFARLVHCTSWSLSFVHLHR